ncbi:putative endonuclease 4 [Trichinella pseudospiralis]|uniref:Putative endonuclease 4 n=1 Tax=Trichinella pseudospiralis TaxID=6337 RepID=A0A0V0YIE2_TRIPS|nr:putative endonuclease 4 [Trichinella pseudospiralis]
MLKGKNREEKTRRLRKKMTVKKRSVTKPSVSAAAAAVNSRQLKKRTNNNIEEEEEEEATAPAEMAKEDVNVDKGLDLEAPPKKRNAVTKKSAATVVNLKTLKSSQHQIRYLKLKKKTLKCRRLHGSLGKLPENAAIVGCRSFSLFLRSNMNWRIVPLKEDENCEKYGFDDRHIIPHGCYLLNAVSTDAEIFRKTCETLLFEVQSCEKLGIKLYAFHPGSTRGIVTIDEACSRVAKVVNEVIAQTKDVCWNAWPVKDLQ